jgi:hypothetical protein
MLFRILLITHNIVRWLVILAAVYVLARAYLGWVRKSAWGKADDQAGLIFSIAFDIQVLVGLIIAILSPNVQVALANIGNAMQVPELRMIVFEHIPFMIVAVVIIHITRARVDKMDSAVSKHRLAAIGFTLALALTLFAIPWSRPLLRGLL